MGEEEKEPGQIEHIFPLNSDAPAHALRSERRAEPTDDDTDCCFTAIQFTKLYPADMDVTLTTPAGRTIKRKFTASKTVRTAFVKKKPDDGEDSDESGIILGGMGSCVNVEVTLADTSDPLMRPVTYKFRLCCNDPKVHKGTVLAFVEKPSFPGGQVTTLPLLKITGVKRSPCPQDV